VVHIEETSVLNKPKKNLLISDENYGRYAARRFTFPVMKHPSPP